MEDKQREECVSIRRENTISACVSVHQHSKNPYLRKTVRLEDLEAN